MSKITLALGSFVAGALVMSLLGNQTSIFVQPALAQRGMVFKGAEPVVPALHGNVVEGSIFENLIQPLDGMDCRNCVFKNVTFEYSGGSYNLVNAVISTPMRLVLKGAAANTVRLLALVNSVNSGTKPKPFQPNAPVIQTVSNVQTMTVDFISPYGLR